MRSLHAFVLLGGLFYCQAALPIVDSAAAEPGKPAPAASGFEHFITRSGNKLLDGDRPFRFVGANMPGLVLPYDWTLYLPDRLHLPTPWEQADALKTLDQMNGRVVRTWNLPMRPAKGEARPWHYVVGPNQFNDEAFKAIDNLLVLANRYRVRVILDLTAESGDYLGGIGTYADYRGKKRAEFYTDPQLKEDYKATVRYVIGRVNSISGIPYRDDKAILAWQFGNEMHSATDAWLTEMAAYIKSLDPNHLVAETRHQPGQPLLVDPNIDLLTRHLYANYRGVSAGWNDAMAKEMAKLAGQRPMFVGEFGPYIDNKMFTPENVEAKVREFLDYVQNEPGICGSLIWSMYFHHNDGGFYWHQIMTYPAVWSYHWPGFPSAEAQREAGVLNALREAAFRIEGRKPTPLPAPDKPELLPIGDVPMFSWRGSAGAIGYDIERAAASGGPWTLLAGNVSDADVAYRPLFSDATARAGETWCYRVKARNGSGVSAPSNVVGPVLVKRVCAVDELLDFTKVKAKSAGLALDNQYNALYAEFLFRAKGDKGEWVSYEVPRDIESVKIVAFCKGDPVDPALQFSADGKTYAAATPQRVETRLPAPPRGLTTGQRRTMVEYAVSPPPGQRLLKIEWKGAMELDRVEIYHP